MTNPWAVFQTQGAENQNVLRLYATTCKHAIYQYSSDLTELVVESRKQSRSVWKIIRRVKKNDEFFF